MSESISGDRSPFDLTGKVALITGGGTGLGLQLARSLGAAGADLILTGRRLRVLDDSCSALQAEGIAAQPLQIDVADRGAVDKALDSLGLTELSILINNAGTASDTRLEELSDDDWDRVIDTNLKGAWQMSRAFVQRFGRERGGNIINIASVLGLSVQKGTGAYTASKAGLIQLTRQMAIEWAKYGVRVNALLPGYYLTDIASDYLESDAGAALVRKIPQRRLGDVSDLHGPILLLASDASRYMTGSSLCVDGGLSIPSI